MFQPGLHTNPAPNPTLGISLILARIDSLSSPKYELYHHWSFCHTKCCCFFDTSHAFAIAARNLLFGPQTSKNSFNFPTILGKKHTIMSPSSRRVAWHSGIVELGTCALRRGPKVSKSCQVLHFSRFCERKKA